MRDIHGIGQKVTAGYRAAPSASDRWIDPRRARYLAPVKGAAGHSQENLLKSYGSRGRVAQLGEHLLCKQGVAGSIPATSPIFSTTCSSCVTSRDAFATSLVT